MQVALHLAEFEAVRRGKRQRDVVLGRDSLQLEIEFSAETLAQRQPPGAVDAAAIGRMEAQLHAATLGEKTLEDELVLGRQAAERGMSRGEIFDELPRRGLGDGDLRKQPAQG